MAKNRIAGHFPSEVAPGWETGFRDDIESLYCPPPSDLMVSFEDPIKYKLRKNLWAVVEELKQSEADRLERRIESLERAALSMRGSIYPIDSLIPGSMVVTKTIHAQVTFEEECYIARFVDANVNASGDSEIDAIEMLKDAIASTFLAFVENEHRLGVEPERQLAVLREFIRSE